jgi:hypothetical protein
LNKKLNLKIKINVSSKCKRINFFCGVIYEKTEVFNLKDSCSISNVYVKCKNEVLLNHKFTMRVKDERNVTIINVKAMLSELKGGDIPVLDDLSKIFSKTKVVFIYIIVELDNVDNIMANEFTIHTE